MKRLLCIGFLIVVTLVLFIRVKDYGFVRYDDYEYIVMNPIVNGGLNATAIHQSFCYLISANWHPFTVISHIVDWHLFQENAGGHHIVSLILHILNVCLLFVLLYKLTDDMWPSFMAAFLFAVHPQHVEAVVWLSERKELLYFLYWLIASLLYAYYVNAQGVRRKCLYGGVLLSMAAGMLCKPMMVTLPCVLLLLDFWPLRRWDIGFGRLLLEKLPLLLLSLVFMLVTLITQSAESAVVSFDALPLWPRVLNAVNSYLVYLYKVAYPSGLSVFYPYVMDQSSSFAVFIFQSFILLSISLLVLFYRKRFPYLLVGWLWYLGTLFPVSGFVQVGEQARADRYTYMTLVGIFMMIAWLVNECLLKFKGKVLLYRSILVAVLVFCTYLYAVAWNQVAVWASNDSLFRHAISWTDKNYLAHELLAIDLEQRGLSDKAREHFEKAVEYEPLTYVSNKRLGELYTLQGHYDSAVDCFKRASIKKPDDPDVYHNLGNVLYMKGDYDRAYRSFKISSELQDSNADSLALMGVISAKKGDLAMAEEHWEEALRRNPAHNSARANIARLRAMQDK